MVVSHFFFFYINKMAAAAFHYRHHAISTTLFTRNFSLTSARYSSSRPLIARYTDQIPLDLARVQSGRHVRLRDYETQVKLKRFSYDLKLKDGKVHPAQGDFFIGAGVILLRLLSFFGNMELFRSQWMLITRANVTDVPRDCSEL